MSFFDRFRAPQLNDPRFGALRFGRGRWTSENASCFGATGVRVRLPGTRDGISPEARDTFDLLERDYPRIKAEALRHFWEHYEPYAEAVDDLEDEAAALVRSIRQPEDLWSHAKVVRVWVDAYGKAGDVELGFETAWDIEHTIGLTISGGRVTDFCGSVGPW